MKYTWILTLMFIAAMTATSTYAQSPTKSITPTSTVTASPAPSDTPLEGTVRSLKDKISDKVEEINKKNKSAIRGKVTEVSSSGFTITTKDSKDFTVTVDDTITTLYDVDGAELDEVEPADIEKDDTVVVSGPTIEGEVSATLVYRFIDYTVLQGQITSVDSDAFTISLISLSKDQFTLDIEKNTRQFIMDSKSLELEKAGFSKFKEGDYIHAVVDSPDDSGKASARRVLIIPQEYFNEETVTEAKAE